MIKTHKTRPCRRLSQVRNELVRVAGAAQDMAPEAEQAWLETVGTWKWGDVTPINSK